MSRNNIYTTSIFIFKISIISILISSLAGMMKWSNPLGHWVTSVIGLILTLSFVSVYFSSRSKGLLMHLRLIACLIILINIGYFTFSFQISPFHSFRGMALLVLILPEIIKIVQKIVLRSNE